MVDHCLCHSISFAELKAIAESEGLDFDSLRRRTRCCTGCGMCEPYVRLVLETGRTRFDVLAPKEVDRIMQRVRTPAPDQ